jgi:hypothetical protein
MVATGDSDFGVWSASGLKMGEALVPSSSTGALGTMLAVGDSTFGV